MAKIKDKYLQVRISSNDYKMLVDVADQLKLTVSELVRISIQPYFIKQKFDLEYSLETTKSGSKRVEFEVFTNGKKILEHYRDQLNEMQKEIKKQLDNYEEAYISMLNYMNNSQMRLGFNRKSEIKESEAKYKKRKGSKES